MKLIELYNAKIVGFETIPHTDTITGVIVEKKNGDRYKFRVGLKLDSNNLYSEIAVEKIR